MKTFRKDTGGYALLYVMVVVAVVCSIVMIISASAVKNYRAQQDSVERMVDKYAAVGTVEKIYLQIQNATATKTFSESAPLTDSEKSALKNSVDEQVVADYVKEILNLDPDPYENKLPDATPEEPPAASSGEVPSEEPEEDPDQTPTKIDVADPVKENGTYKSKITVTCKEESASVEMEFILDFKVNGSDKTNGTTYSYSADVEMVSTEVTRYEIGGAS